MQVLQKLVFTWVEVFIKKEFSDFELAGIQHGYGEGEAFAFLTFGLGLGMLGGGGHEDRGFCGRHATHKWTRSANLQLLFREYEVGLIY